MGLAHFGGKWDIPTPVSKQETLFTEAEMIEYGIQSVQTISEATWAPRLLITLTDGRQISSAMKREMIEDLKFYGIDVTSSVKNMIKKEIEHYGVPQKREIKRVYSDVDPYGEEDWEK